MPRSVSRHVVFRLVVAAAFNRGNAGFTNASNQAVLRQLTQLDAEAEKVANKLDDAWADLRKHPRKTVFREIVQYLQKEKADLDEMRKMLLVKLSGADGAGKLLTLHQAVRFPLYTLAYTHDLLSSTRSSSSQRVTVKVERWEEFDSDAEEFITALPNTTRLFQPPEVTAEMSGGERDTRLLLRDTHFAFVQQLGGHAGLPKMHYCWTRQDEEGGQSVRFQSHMDEGWVWRNPAGRLQLVVAVEAKQAFARPFQPGWEFVDLYNMPEADAEAAQVMTPWRSVQNQLQQLLRNMRKEQVPYGVLYSDVGYWFFFDNAAEEVLKVSRCYCPSQLPPVTLVAAILYLGHLAVRVATWTDCRALVFRPSASSATSPSAQVAPLLAATAASNAAAQQPATGPAASGAQAATGAQPSTGAQEGVLCSLTLGCMVSRGSTGAVYEARMPGDPKYPKRFAVKVAQAYPDGRRDSTEEGAVQRLLHELDVYQGSLADLQGVAVPRVLGYGVLDLGGESGWRPFIALPLLGPSLRDATQPLLPEQEQAILAALDQLHCAGVLHGDVRSANIVLPPSDDGDGSEGHSPQPLWVDFSHAELFDPAHPQAPTSSKVTYGSPVIEERALCKEMLQSLQQACRVRAVSTGALPPLRRRACTAAPVLHLPPRLPARQLVRRATPSAPMRCLHRPLGHL